MLGPHTSEPYNPNIARVFYLAGYIETWGRGVEKIFETCEELGAPKPEYSILGNGVTVRFPALQVASTDSKTSNRQNGGLDGGLDDALDKRILTEIRSNPSLTQKELSDITNIPFANNSAQIKRNAGCRPHSARRWQTIWTLGNFIIFTQDKEVPMGHVFISADTRLRIHDLIKHTEGMTQAKLAKELGISESTLSRFLSGQTTKMGNDRIIKIANIFNVSTDFLLGETNIPVKKNYDISELGLSAEAAQAFHRHPTAFQAAPAWSKHSADFWSGFSTAGIPTE